MNYYDFQYISNTEEFGRMVDNNEKCQMTEEQYEKVKTQVSDIFGETEIEVSLRGLVFSKPENRNEDTYYLGRIDRNFNFYCPQNA